MQGRRLTAQTHPRQTAAKEAPIRSEYPGNAGTNLRFAPMKFATLVISIVLLTPSLSAKFRETVEASHPLNADGLVTLNSAAGSVEIIGWAKNEIHITATKWAATEEDLANIHVRIEAALEHTSILTEFKKKGRSIFKRLPDGGVDYVVHVPFATTLENVTVDDGDLTITDVKGSVNLTAATGFTRATGLASSANLDNGTGAIVIAFDRIDPTAQISMRTRGACRLTLPPEPEVSIVARAAEATVRCDLPVEVTRSRSNLLEGTLGGGGAALEIRTTNGAITIE